jgi:hypothetical protein
MLGPMYDPGDKTDGTVDRKLRLLAWQSRKADLQRYLEQADREIARLKEQIAKEAGNANPA